MRKKANFFTLMFASSALLAFTGCSTYETEIRVPTTTYPSVTAPTTSSETTYDALSTATPDFLYLKSPTPDSTEVDVVVPYFPDSIIFLDYVAYDMCAAWGVLESFDYLTIQKDMPSYLQPYMLKESVDLAESLTVSDLSLVMDLEPDLVFSNRGADNLFDTLNDNWPTLSYNFNYGESTYEKYKMMLLRNGSVFGLEAQNTEFIKFFDRRFYMIKEQASGQSALIVMFTEDGMVSLSDDSYGSILFHDMGFKNSGSSMASFTEISFEDILALNPDYLVVLDRNFDVATDALLDDTFLQQTSAWQNEKMIYLDPTAAYGLDLGTLGLDIVLSNVEKALNISLSHQLTNVFSIWWDDEEFHPTSEVYNLLDPSTMS